MAEGVHSASMGLFKKIGHLQPILPTAPPSLSSQTSLSNPFHALIHTPQRPCVYSFSVVFLDMRQAWNTLSLCFISCWSPTKNIHLQSRHLCSGGISGCAGLSNFS